MHTICFLLALNKCKLFLCTCLYRGGCAYLFVNLASDHVFLCVMGHFINCITTAGCPLILRSIPPCFYLISNFLCGKVTLQVMEYKIASWEDGVALLVSA